MMAARGTLALVVCCMMAALACWAPTSQDRGSSVECDHDTPCPFDQACVGGTCMPSCVVLDSCDAPPADPDAGGAGQDAEGGLDASDPLERDSGLHQGDDASADPEPPLDPDAGGGAPDTYSGYDAAPPGRTCADAPCFPGVTCADQPTEVAPGSGDYFTCGSCPAGYAGDGTTCADVDECATDPCGANETCTNTAGSYTCTDDTPSDCTLWDYSASRPCSSGYYNCDCSGGCGGTSPCGSTPPDDDPPDDCTLWDYNASAPCPSGYYNCDCANGCGGTNPCGTNPPDPGGPYETEFHHTTTASSDGGKSLVLCPGQRMNFDACSCNGVNIPRHGDDNNRETYWNMHAEPVGDIVCRKGGSEYRYRADGTLVYGDCS